MVDAVAGFGIGGLFSPCVYTAYHTNVRDGIKHKYGLPDDELCGATTCTTYLPNYLPGILPDCTVCAAYQLAYFMKYDAPNKSDFDCCLYTMCCKKTVYTSV